MQVLHTRSRSGIGLHFVRFLAACYLVFSLDYANVTKALDSIPPILSQKAASGIPPNADTNLQKAEEHP